MDARLGQLCVTSATLDFRFTLTLIPCLCEPSTFSVVLECKVAKVDLYDVESHDDDEPLLVLYFLDNPALLDHLYLVQIIQDQLSRLQTSLEHLWIGIHDGG